MTATQSGSNEAAPPLRLTDAVFGYDGRLATGPLNLVITGGEVVALLGANGSGKTTLVRGVLGLAEHHAGEVSLFGVPARRFKERWRIGYVPQRNSVAGTVPATVWEVVASGRLRRNRPFGLLTADDRAALRSALATSGLEGLEGRRVADLSGGQQRRVLIARALATRPELLILDEPTAGVDAERQELLAETLERLVRGGTTVLLVAHELGPAEPVITRTVVMTEGRLTYDGSPLPSHRHHDCGGEHLHLHGDTPDVSSLHIGSW